MAALYMNASIFNPCRKTTENLGLYTRKSHNKHAEGLLWKQPKSKFDVYCQSNTVIDSMKSVVSVLDQGMILSEPDNAGIGITKFLRGKTLFVTGATGFLGKAFLEKILRAIPDVRKIYIMVKAKSKEAALERLHKEILETELFKCLQQQHREHKFYNGPGASMTSCSRTNQMCRYMWANYQSPPPLLACRFLRVVTLLGHLVLLTCSGSTIKLVHGESYLAFMLRKIVPVIGNVGETNLGLDEDIEDVMKDEIEIILNSAADTSFNQRYDTMLDINTHGPSNLMRFAKKCHNIKLFVHVSTAFVSGKREGTFEEKSINETVSVSPVNLLDVENEMKLLLEARKGIEDDLILSQKLKQFGLERAQKLGWQNAYALTKAMGEMMIDSMKGDLPVVVIRPACIKSTYREPFPGWIEGTRVLDPVILFYGKGHLTGFVAGPENDPDIVPVDMVVNATIAAIALHGAAGNPENLIYHVASSVANTISYKDLVNLFYDHFERSPVIDSKGIPIRIPKMKLLNSMKEFDSHYSQEQVCCPSDQTTVSHVAKLNRKIFEQLQLLNDLYKEFTLSNARFECTNTKTLIGCMSEEEKQQFGFDVTDIDWKEYIVNIHIPGFRKHVMKGRLG